MTVGADLPLQMEKEMLLPGAGSAGGQQALDLGVGIAELGQDLTRVLAQDWGVRFVRAGAAGEAVGDLRAADAALGGMVLGAEEADVGQVRIIEQGTP